jgi:hypothetical protein
MNEKIVFIRTSSGEDEVRSRTAHLSKDIKRALLMVDGTATVAEIMKRSSPSLRGMLEDMFTELAKGGFIQDKSRAGRPSKLITPPPSKKSSDEVDELDFTAAYRVPTAAELSQEAARLQVAGFAEKGVVADSAAALDFAPVMTTERARLAAEMSRSQADAHARALAEEKARQEAEAARAQAEQQAAAARFKAEQEAERAAMEARVQAEAVRHAKEAAEVARKAELHAAQVKAEAEARGRAVAEEKAQLAAELARLKQQAEADARARAEEHARQEADLLRAQVARREADNRLKMEQEAAEAAARLESERHAKAAVLAARRAEQEAAEARAEAEARARAVAEEKAALEAEVARLKLQAEAEAQARVVAEQQAKREAEAAEAERRESGMRAKAEQEAARVAARLQAEQQAAEVKAEAEARAQAVAEEKRKLEAEVAGLKAQAEAQAQARAEAEALARQEAEAARVKAEQEAQRARMEAEKARLEKAQAEQEAERARQEAERIKAEQEAERLKAEQEAERLKAEQEAERIKAEQEAERIKAEQEAERIKAEQEAERIKAEQEAERLKAEQEAERIQSEQEAERIKAEQEAERIRQEAERIKAEQETERLKAEQEVERLKAEQEAERLKAEQEAERIQSEQEAERIKAEQEAERLKAEQEAERVRAERATPARERRVSAAAVSGCDSRGGNNGIPVVERKTTTAAVLFFDIADYAKQPEIKQLELKQQFDRLLDDSLSALESDERITLNTESGAAIGFLQHPTDALEAVTHFRAIQIAHKHYDNLRVRIGIHLGPVSLIKDLNGQINMLGDGVNSAQRVMEFAGQNQIYVSRAYFDFVSGLNHAYDDLFRYRGAQQGPDGREYQVYELLDAEGDMNEVTSSVSRSDDFNFEAFDTQLGIVQDTADRQVKEIQFSSVADQLLMDSVGWGSQKTVPDEPEQQKTVVSQEPPERVEAQTDSYSEAEALQLADAQAAKWAEAAQRAEELARKKAANPVFQQSVGPAPVVVAKPRRKPLPWGKLSAGLLLVMLLALFIMPAVLPAQAYRESLERMLGATLHQPVHIAYLSGRMLPTPRLVLDDLSVGADRQIKIRQAQINFSFAALTGAEKPVKQLNLDGVEVKGEALSQVSDWLQQLARDPHYPVAQINLTGAKLVAEGLAFSDVSGELDFDPAGQFTQARLNALGHKLALEIHAAPENKMQLQMTLRDNALPLFPSWVFDELKASGELTRDELHIADFDGRIRGGVLTGNARINWRSGWRVQGVLEAHVIPLKNINKLLDGDLNGKANFQMQAVSVDKLADAAILNGVFSVDKGLISGVDIVETTRLHSRESLPGGRTHFDALSGELSYANGSYHFGSFRISDSVFKAVGTMTVAQEQLSGHVSSDLLMRASSAALQIEGDLDTPSLHVAR